MNAMDSDPHRHDIFGDKYARKTVCVRFLTDCAFFALFQAAL
jgi:hypothetical protein